jgi:hypothetical protein
MIGTAKLEARKVFVLNFKGTLSQEEYTIFSSLNIYDMTLSDQIDFLAFFPLRKMTFQNFINSGIRQSAVTFDPALRCHVLEN